jgi:microcystin-dependent protein
VTDFDPLPPVNVSLQPLCPTGTIHAFAGEAEPDKPRGWVPCDGSAYPPNFLKELFDVIGYRFGRTGNNFHVPDLRGRVVVGAGAGVDLSPRALGDTFGRETQALTVAQLPRHDHRTCGAWHPLGSEAKSPKPFSYVSTTNLSGGGTFGSGWEYDGVGTSDTGEDAAHPNIQPSVALNYIIKY